MKFREAQKKAAAGEGMVLSSARLQKLRSISKDLYSDAESVMRSALFCHDGPVIECSDGGYYAPFKVELHPVSVVSGPGPVLSSGPPCPPADPEKILAIFREPPGPQPSEVVLEHVSLMPIPGGYEEVVTEVARYPINAALAVDMAAGPDKTAMSVVDRDGMVRGYMEGMAKPSGWVGEVVNRITAPVTDADVRPVPGVAFLDLAGPPPGPIEIPREAVTGYDDDVVREPKKSAKKPAKPPRKR